MWDRHRMICIMGDGGRGMGPRSTTTAHYACTADIMSNSPLVPTKRRRWFLWSPFDIHQMQMLQNIARVRTIRPT